MRFRRRAGRQPKTEPAAAPPAAGPVRFDPSVRTAAELLAAATEEDHRPPSGGRAA